MKYKSSSVDRFKQVSQFQSLNELKERKMNHLNKTINPYETMNKEISKRNLVTKELDHTKTSSRVPKPFVQLVKCYFDFKY